MGPTCQQMAGLPRLAGLAAEAAVVATTEQPEALGLTSAVAVVVAATTGTAEPVETVENTAVAAVLVIPEYGGTRERSLLVVPVVPMGVTEEARPKEAHLKMEVPAPIRVHWNWILPEKVKAELLDRSPAAEAAVTAETEEMEVPPAAEAAVVAVATVEMAETAERGILTMVMPMAAEAAEAAATAVMVETVETVAMVTAMAEAAVVAVATGPQAPEVTAAPTEAPARTPPVMPLAVVLRRVSPADIIAGTEPPEFVLSPIMSKPSIGRRLKQNENISNRKWCMPMGRDW